MRGLERRERNIRLKRLVNRFSQQPMMEVCTLGEKDSMATLWEMGTLDMTRL